MAFTITDGEVALMLRITTDPDNVPKTAQTILKYLIPAGKEMIERYAPKAPTDINNTALAMLVGVLYDQDPSNPITANPIIVSGAQTILAKWRDHRAESINPELVVVNNNPASGLPPFPADNNMYLLSVEEGNLTWLKFPQP